MSSFMFVVTKDGEQIVINQSNVTKGYAIEENGKFYPVVECGDETYYVGWSHGDKKSTGWDCWDDAFEEVWRALPIFEDWEERHRERKIKVTSKILQGLLANGSYSIYNSVEEAIKLAERLFIKTD